MLVVRCLRFLARFGLGVALLLPMGALLAAVWLDRGPNGETRISPHGFPLILWLFDDFPWTCARNSLMFATFTASLSALMGSSLGWVVARRQFWGRAVVRGFVVSLLVVPPMFLALGLHGILGTPRPWPWPFAGGTAGIEGVSLESWRGLPLWMVWVWSTLPWGVALVMVATAAAVEKLEPSWEDAAALMGASRIRDWRRLFWPLVRPHVARAAAVVFVFALAEPGAPLVLGLRRTLAFQVIDTSKRAEPFPRAAVWALMTGLFALAGWLTCRWAGGNPILQNQTGAHSRLPSAQPLRPMSAGRGVVSLLLLSVCPLIGWMPVAGLGQLALAARRHLRLDSSSASPMFLDDLRRFWEPPAPAILFNSLILGLTAACVTIALASLRFRAGEFASSTNRRARLARRLAMIPPLVQGLGLLGIPWIVGLAAQSLKDSGQLHSVAAAMSTLATELDPFRNSWLMLLLCVSLSLAPRFLVLWPWDRRDDESGRAASSARDAARLIGVGRASAARLARGAPRRHQLAAGILAGTFAATNLVPALFFVPWSDQFTIAPAVLNLAAGHAHAREQAAALALIAIACNLAALAWAWLASSLPEPVEIE